MSYMHDDVAVGSFEEVHVIDVESFIDQSLKPAQKLQLIHLPRPHFAVLLEHPNPVLLAVDLRAEVGVVVDEVVEEGSDGDVVIGRRVGVGVNAEVEVDGNHRVVDHPAASSQKY